MRELRCYAQTDFLQLRIPKIINDRINLLPGLAEWTVMRRIGLVVYEIIRMEDRMHRIILDHVSGTEDGGDTLDDTAIITDTFQTLGNRFTGRGGSQKKDDVFSAHHRLDIVAEDHLSVGIKFRFYYINTLVHIHGDNTGVR